jgi:hypothetical protein
MSPLYFLVPNILVSAVISRSAALTTLHALTVFAVGMYWAMTGRQLLVACAGAYIAGMEVFWRMAHAWTPWEFGKYSLSAMLLISSIRLRGFRGSPLAVCYLALMTPSVGLLLVSNPPNLVQDVSFYMSGPFALAVSIWFFDGLGMTRRDLAVILLSGVSAVAGPATIVLIAIRSVDRLVFSGESNNAVTAGFGANQVSAILGLGVFLGFLVLMAAGGLVRQKISLYAAMFWYAVLCGLTFSRFGLYGAVGSMLVASLFLTRDARAAGKVVGFALVSGLICYYLVVPALDSLTDGAILRRFQDTKPSGRDVLAKSDIRIWLENPLLGVGPGQSKELHREEFGEAVAAHTEITRHLAEHGTLGLAALLVLSAQAWLNLRRARSAAGRAVAASLITWTVLFTMAVAFRLSTPAFMFGLSCALLLPDVDEAPAHDPGPPPPEGPAPDPVWGLVPSRPDEAAHVPG